MFGNIFKKEHAKVVFSADYIYGLSSIGEHQTFDIMRFKKIRDKLVEEKLLKRKNILRPDSCTTDDIRLVHTEKYIKQIQDPQFVSRLLKLDEVNLFYNSVLEFYKAVTGGTLLATAYALKWNKHQDMIIILKGRYMVVTVKDGILGKRKTAIKLLIKQCPMHI